MGPLTERQAEVLAFLRERIAIGETPTLAAIAEEFGWHGRTSAVCHLEALARKGAIEWIRDGKSCGIRLAGKRCTACGGTGVTQ